MGRRRIAEIEWTYPKEYNSLKEYYDIDGSGLYSITRRFGHKQTLLYIGKTIDQNFAKRLRSHKRKWFDNYKGNKSIRLGFFNKPDSPTSDVA